MSKHTNLGRYELDSPDSFVKLFATFRETKNGNIEYQYGSHVITDQIKESRIIDVLELEVRVENCLDKGYVKVLDKDEVSQMDKAESFDLVAWCDGTN